MTAARLVVLRAPALAEPVEQDALVALAQRLAAELQATLDVVELQTGGAAADTGAAAGGAAAQAGNADAAAWWRVRHAQAGSDEAPVLAALCDAALAALPAPAARTVVLLPAGSLGVELAAALAALRQGVSFGRSESLAREGTALVARRLVFGGRAEAAVRSEAAWCFAALRGAGEHAAAAPAPPVRTLAIAPALPPSWTRAPLPSGDRLPALEGARLVVSGGRGIGGEAGFALLAQVAERLGGALGGSLPTVDAGWVPVARQVGQSGKFVAPRVYLAVGISGTLQHLAGVAPASAIVAINNDPEAAIFRVAQVGAVADWQRLLPALIAELDRRGPAG